MCGEFECTPVFGQSTNEDDDDEWELGRDGCSLSAWDLPLGRALMNE